MDNLPIPVIREQMTAMASALRQQAALLSAQADTLDALAAASVRKTTKSRAPVVSVKMTPELRGKIRRYSLENPRASTQGIANIFGVNPGRVTEALQDTPGDQLASIA